MQRRKTSQGKLPDRPAENVTKFIIDDHAQNRICERLLKTRRTKKYINKLIREEIKKAESITKETRSIVREGKIIHTPRMRVQNGEKIFILERYQNEWKRLVTFFISNNPSQHEND